MVSELCMKWSLVCSRSYSSEEIISWKRVGSSLLLEHSMIYLTGSVMDWGRRRYWWIGSDQVETYKAMMGENGEVVDIWFGGTVLEILNFFPGLVGNVKSPEISKCVKSSTMSLEMSKFVGKIFKKRLTLGQKEHFCLWILCVCTVFDLSQSQKCNKSVKYLNISVILWYTQHTQNIWQHMSKNEELYMLWNITKSDQNCNMTTTCDNVVN